MKTGRLVVAVMALIASAGLVATATPAGAGGPFGGLPASTTPPVLLMPPIVPHGGDNIVPHGVTGDTIVPHGLFRLPVDARFGPPVAPRFTPPPPFHHHFRGSIPSVVVTSPPVIVVAPSAGSYDESGGYYVPSDDAAAVYAPPMPDTQPTVVVAPSGPPTPNVIQYPTGRYELRGDGMSTAYTWVWIPNPPPAPPSAPPTAPPVAGPSSPGRSWSPGPGAAYRWTDAEGVLHITDRLEAVPPEYREQARQSRPS